MVAKCYQNRNEEVMTKCVAKCMDCGSEIPLMVCKSAAGFYLGQWCPQCGPYDRHSGYYPTREMADKLLEEWIEETS